MLKVCLIYNAATLQDRKHISRVENTAQAFDCFIVLPTAVQIKWQAGHSVRDIDCLCDEQDVDVFPRVFSQHNE